MLFTWNLLVYNIVHGLWKVKVKVTSDSLWPQGLYSPWNSPGQNTGVGSLSLSPGDQSSQPRDWSQVSRIAGKFLYQLSHTGSPRTLEWVAYPFSSRSFQPSNQTAISCIAGRFFTDWAIWETLYLSLKEHLSKSRSNSHLWESSKANLPGGKNLHQVSPPYAFHRPPSLMHKKGQFLLYSQYFPVTFKELTVIELRKINDGPLNF